MGVCSLVAITATIPEPCPFACSNALAQLRMTRTGGWSRAPRTGTLCTERNTVDIEAIKSRVRDGTWLISAHADQEAADENIDIAEIRDAILGGEILEQYADTGRGPSCLLLGFVNGRPIHVVCGWGGSAVVIITVYVPKPPKFENPWTRRRSR